MINVCPKCGLNKELCVCDIIAKEKQKITVSIVERRYGKKATIIESSDTKDVGLKEIAKILKSHLACGGTVKNGIIELQGNHLRKVKEELIKLGFSPDTIEIINKLRR